MTYDEILENMLSEVPDTLDKRKGSLIYLSLAPAAHILSLLYEETDKVYNDTFADTATKDNLTRRCAERGIHRKQATNAIRKGMFNIPIQMSSRFSIDDTTYITIEVQDKEAKLKCEQEGEIGNTRLGDMLPITYIKGLEKATLIDILVPGEDEENDESLRRRYFESLNSLAFGGNIADYKAKTKSIQGVGGVKVYPVWDGGGTVKVTIIDSMFSKPSEELINIVQTILDPVINSGEGFGLAPIGHKVTVVGVEEKKVNIKSKITLVNGYVWEDVKPIIKEEIAKYFTGLCKTWENEETMTIRISNIESTILRIRGVLDIENTIINNIGKNLILTGDQVPILIEITQI